MESENFQLWAKFITSEKGKEGERNKKREREWEGRRDREGRSRETEREGEGEPEGRGRGTRKPNCIRTMQMGETGTQRSHGGHLFA